jgi:putative flippase GtrA
MTQREQNSSKDFKFTKSLITQKRTSIFHKIYYYLISIPVVYRYKTKLKYASLGLFGEFVDFVVLIILTSFLNVFYLLSTIIAYVSAVFTNFYLHKNYTFKYHTKSMLSFLLAFLKYFMVSITGLIITVILMSVFVELIGLHYLLSKLIIGMIVFSLNYNLHSNILSPPRIFKIYK